MLQDKAFISIRSEAALALTRPLTTSSLSRPTRRPNATLFIPPATNPPPPPTSSSCMSSLPVCGPWFPVWWGFQTKQSCYKERMWAPLFSISSGTAIFFQCDVIFLLCYPNLVISGPITFQTREERSISDNCKKYIGTVEQCHYAARHRMLQYPS